jgi:internalin A
VKRNREDNGLTRPFKEGNMINDLELVTQLGKEIGEKFEKVSLENLEHFPNCFVFDHQSHVAGISIGLAKMYPFPRTLFEFHNLKVLHISKCKLKDSKELSNLNGLTALDLRENHISDISALEKLKGLTTLNLSGNQIRDISALKELKGLMALDLSDNEITDISDLKELTALEILNLKGTQITDISILKELKGLTTLNLSATQITDTSILKSLKELTILNLSATQIREFPILKELNSLKILDLRDNKNVTHFPPELVDMGMEIKWERPHDRHESGIFLEGNMLDSLPLEIVKKGTEAIREYFKSLEGEKRALNEVKILLVGEGAAGKTSLAKQLLGRPFAKGEYPTHGININPWYVLNDKSGETYMKVNIWDFGGQEIMHATHQFFLSKRSLYILVLDGRKDEKDEYWLDHIKTFGGDSPVMVVLNKIDENPGFKVNQKFLTGKYPNIKGFFRISCATKDGIEEFVEKLTMELAAIEHIKMIWGSNWFNVKERLEGMNVPFINYEKYQRMCAEARIEREQERRLLLGFLNDLGVAIHFSDLNLLNTHVLEPKWITNAVYKIINSKILSDCKGILALSELEEILKPGNKDDYTYPEDKHKYIIDLMCKFELCFKIDEHRVLLPDLLDVEEMEIDFDYENSLKFQVKYSFLPKSVMPRFIVKRNNEIDGNLRWRTGVVLKDKRLDASSVVKTDEREKTIHIFVNGSYKEDHLVTILDTFKRINDSFEQLEVKERLPLPDNPKVVVSCSYLRRMEKKGILTFLPEGADKIYNVKALLDVIKPSKERFKEMEPPQKEGSPPTIVTVNPINVQTVTQIQEMELNLSVNLPSLQEEFEALKDLLVQLKPESRGQLEGLGDALDALSSKSDKEKLNGPLNKLGRFLKKVGDENSDYYKILKGAKKGIETLQKVGRTYNKIVQWVGLPQVPDAFL